MEKFSNDYAENVRVLDGLLGVGRSCDMVSRDYLIGGRRARPGAARRAGPRGPAGRRARRQ